MASSKLEVQSSFVSMNWSGGVWHHSRIHAKLSLTPKRFTLARQSAKEHWFRAITHDSARRGSKPGLLSPRQPPRPRNPRTRDALSASSTERMICEAPESHSGIRMSHARHAAGTGGQGNRSYVERPA